MLSFAAALVACGSARGAPSTPEHDDSTSGGEAFALTSWLARLHRAGADAEALTALLTEVDPAYSPELATDLPLAGIDVLRGQLDRDAELETVVQVRHHPASYDAGMERTEAFWVGIFDATPRGERFVGAVRERVEHCNFDDAPLGLLLGFVERQRALRVRVQRSESCGTLVAFAFDETEHRILEGRLEARSVAAPEGMNHDRLRFPDP